MTSIKMISQPTEENVLTANGVQLAFTDAGSGIPAVLLIHGHPFDRTMWQPQVEFLKKTNRVVVPDLRGFGESSMPDGCREIRLETFAKDNLDLMDALGIRKFALAGLSMGGQIVLEIIRQAPDRVLALMLADTFASLDTPERKQWRYTTADRLESEGMDRYADEQLTKMIAPTNATQLPEVAAHVMRMMTNAPPSGAAAALRGRAERIDYVPLLGQIRVPTMVVMGKDDAYTTTTQVEQLRNEIPGAQVAIIDGAGHMPNLEQPEAFNAVLGEWLRGL